MKPKQLLAAAIVLALSASYACWQAGYFSGDTASDGSVRVVRVVDGDTAVVREGGRDQTIRFLDINTPETVDPRKPVQCYGHEASAEMHKLLDGKRVMLVSAVGRENTDKYGRELRYVHLQDGTDVNLFMIKEGFAHEYTVGSPSPSQQPYRAAEAQAKAAKRGMWADPACAAQSMSHGY